jgi:hypothetical protein
MRAAVRTACALVALGALIGCASSGRLGAVSPGDVDPVPGEDCAVIATDGAWSWFGGPRALTVGGDVARTYVGWVTSGGDVRVGAYDHVTGGVESATMHADFHADDHANPTLLLDADDRLMVFYTGHRGRWAIYRQMLRPHDLEGWTRERAAGPYSKDVGGYTYPSPCRLGSRGDSVVVFWRGPGLRSSFAASGDRKDWTPSRSFLPDADQLYFRVACDDGRTVHVAFNDGHPRRVSDNSLYYVRLRGDTFERADGTPVAHMSEMPVVPAAADLVYEGSSPEGRSWLWDVAADSLGHPVIVYAVFPTEQEHRYRYARWTGETWENHDITSAGSWFPTVQEGFNQFEPYYSGGLCLDHDDPSIVYLSRPVNGVYEIERWATADGGSTWTARPVTAGSVQNNVRPVVPRNARSGGPSVVWMHGYYSDYLDYRTDIRAR